MDLYRKTIACTMCTLPLSLKSIRPKGGRTPKGIRPLHSLASTKTGTQQHFTMARGQQAVQAQQKNAKKKEKEMKRKANKGNNNKINEDFDKTAKCKMCMLLMQQLNMEKPGSLIPLSRHQQSKHAKATLADCFPDWTPERIAERLAGKGEQKEEPRPVEEYGAEVAVKEFSKEVRQAAISECEGGKEAWKAMSWMQRYEILNPVVTVFKVDKEVKGKKKQSHKRH